ncbi:MAG: type IV toxin-antitoxin system AbiEi family antitoxin domain-containing protein [Ignavibacteriaceae bacterium]|nr:type IV toxin-antitoxin system AbiEi family antitoxin domain-containing protein [Ignavibacteriaceae bacterium]
MSEIRSVFQEQNGYARMHDLKIAGIHTRKIAAAVKTGEIEKIRPGLYRLAEYPRDQFSSYYDIYAANDKAVICLVSASAFHELTDYIPEETSIALPRNYTSFAIEYPPVNIYYFPEKHLKSGAEFIITDNGRFKVFSAEKTIADLFRYRKKTGDDIVLESLKNYLSRKNRDINKLLEYSAESGVQKQMMPYLKAMVI